MIKCVNTSYAGAAYNKLMNIAEEKWYDEFVLVPRGEEAESGKRAYLGWENKNKGAVPVCMAGSISS